MLYFAYGSNMDWDRMRARCPSAAFLCVARLDGFQVELTRECRDGFGVADIVANDTSSVWGAVFMIPETEVGRLDRAEGYNPQKPTSACARDEYRVYANGCDDQPHTVWSYAVRDKQGPFRTVGSYKDHILKGARHWGLPREYVEQLEKIEVKNGT
jgi:gamma-glutamylcyclotransferase (GGCT)/AIG2-like uncharacterized protein YtfP